MIGDRNAVRTILHCSRRLLVRSGAIAATSLLMEGLPFPGDQQVADTFIGDLVPLVSADIALLDVVSLQGLDDPQPSGKQTMKHLRRSSSRQNGRTG